MGWRLGRDLSNRPALQALSMAFRIANDRGVDICNGSLVHHSDRGVQYASKEYVEKLRSARIGISMTGCGDPKENAIAERINSTLKNEILDKRRFESYKRNKLIFEQITKCNSHWKVNYIENPFYENSKENRTESNYFFEFNKLTNVIIKSKIKRKIGLKILKLLAKI